jgi:hypothetical protein
LRKAVVGVIILIILLILGIVLFTVHIPVYTYKISPQTDQPGASETSVPPNFSAYINPRSQVKAQGPGSALEFNESGLNVNVASPFYASFASIALTGEVILGGTLNSSNGMVPLATALTQYGTTASGNASLSAQGGVYQSPDDSTSISISSFSIQTGFAPSSSSSSFTVNAQASGVAVKTLNYNLAFSSGSASGNVQVAFAIYSLLSKAMTDNNGTITNDALDNASTMVSGTLSISMQGVTLSNPDNSTTIQASSLSGETTLSQTPQAGVYQVTLNWQLKGVQIHSPSYSGRVSSISLSGTLTHNAVADQTTGSISASVAPGSIIEGFLGL